MGISCSSLSEHDEHIKAATGGHIPLDENQSQTAPNVAIPAL